MKRNISGILALVLALMPVTSFAEEGSGNTTEPGTAPAGATSGDCSGLETDPL
jgi:hypothetical protein